MGLRDVENIEVPGQGLRRVEIFPMKTAVGFTGTIKNGLRCSPSGDKAYYPLGSSITVRHITAGGGQEFLTGHTHPIGCLALSNSGKYLATGETHLIGSKVQVIIWDTNSLKAIGQHLLHRASVAAVGISPNDRFVASAGGEDDPNVCVWDMESKTPICMSKRTSARPFVASCLAFSTFRDDVFMLGGQDAVVVWKFNEENRKLSQTSVTLGKVKRSITNLLVSASPFNPADDYAFCATSSGDIVKLYLADSYDRLSSEKVEEKEENVRLKKGLPTGGRSGPGNIVQSKATNAKPPSAVVACAIKRAPKKSVMNAGKFSGGALCILEIKPDEFMVGSGDGNVSLIRDSTVTAKGNKQNRHKSVNSGVSTTVKEPTEPCLTEIRSSQFSGAVTSLARLDEFTVIVGCESGDIFQMDILTFDSSLLSTCHTGLIKDVAFPSGLDAVLATCGEDGIRLWETATGKQLLHIHEDGCSVAECIEFSADGKLILSGWSDGCIRAYTPETGKLIFIAQGVHPPGVSAMTILSSGNRANALLTGGKNGQMRSWKMPSIWSLQQKVIGKPKLLMTVKEHTSDIVKIHVTKDQKECITGSKDGTCIIWDIRSLESIYRRQILHATWSLVSALYHPSECQVLTLALDAQLCYWEVIDGKEIRHLVLGKHSTVTALDVSHDGESFITATDSSLVKVWKYKQGSLFGMARAHSGPISKVTYSPSGKHIAAITKHGAIVIWEF